MKKGIPLRGISGCGRTENVSYKQCNLNTSRGLNIVDIDLPFVAELEGAFTVFFGECIRLIDLGALWKLPIRFHWRGRVSDRNGTIQQGGDSRFLASSAVYLTMTSALSSWNSRSESSTMSPWLIHTWKVVKIIATIG